LRFEQLLLSLPAPYRQTPQKFSAVHAASHNHFNQDRRLISRDQFKARRSAALAEWQVLAIW